MVILEGKPWGLKMMSGTIPDSVNGMFSTGHFWLKQKHVNKSIQQQKMNNNNNNN